MAKDPSFLFYPQDFITGTVFMTDEEIGVYIRLLCAQHQHGGILPKKSFDRIAKDFELVREKFIETEDGFYNLRLMMEIDKRKLKSTNLSANAMQRWEKEKQKQCKSNAIALSLQMPSEDENEDENEKEDVYDSCIKKEKKIKTEIPDHLKEVFPHFIDMRNRIGKKMTEHAKKLIFDKLQKMGNEQEQIKILEQSIQNSWQGVFPIKNFTGPTFSNSFKSSRNDPNSEENKQYKEKLGF